MVKDMEDNVMKGALIVPFIRVPEFHEVIIGGCINEVILEEHLHCKHGIMILKDFCVVLSVWLNPPPLCQPGCQDMGPGCRR